MKTDASGHVYLLGLLPKGHQLQMREDALTESMSGANKNSFFVARLSPNGACDWVKELELKAAQNAWWTGKNDV